jgi:rod shape determining protein RodA
MPDVSKKYSRVKPYPFDRIYAWLDPENHVAVYHLSNSLKAIDSGLLAEKGSAKDKYIFPKIILNLFLV